MTKPLDAFTAAEIEAAMGVLTPRERRIFEALRPAEDLIALEELSIEFGIARVRVRQVNVQAMEKVQSAIEASRTTRANVPLPAEIQALLGRVREHLPLAEAHIAGAELYGAPRLSTFQLLAPNENALSRVLAELLDCRGSHGQGELFLNEFLRVAKLPLVGSVEARRVRVTREFRTDEQRRIDIVVETPTAVLGIENKPWAAQQDNQLPDYDAHLRRTRGEKPFALIFISDQFPQGELRSLVRVAYRSDQSDVITLDYLLRKTLPLIKAERTRLLIEDFVAFLRAHFGGGIMTTESDDAYLDIVRREFEASPASRKAVVIFMRSANRLHHDILAEIGDFIKSKVEEKVSDIEVCHLTASYNVELKDVKLTLDDRWRFWGLRRSSWPVNCAIAIDSDRGDQREVYFGVYAPDGSDDAVKPYPACPSRPQLDGLSEKLTVPGKKTVWWPWRKPAETPTWNEAFVARLILETADGDIKAHPEIKELADRIVGLAAAVDQSFSSTGIRVPLASEPTAC